jgi:FMN-dependent NADH-azoreductase
MTKVLHIISSPRGTESLTIKLGNAIIDKIKATNSNVVVTELDLSKNPYPHLEEVHINSFFTPKEYHTPEQATAIKNSDEAIATLQEADIVIIGAPMYNFSITSGLKAYFDHVARAGITFRYSENGVEGLLKNKKAYIAFASGGVFSNGYLQPLDFAVPYIKHFLTFIGIAEITVFRAEGAAIPGLKETALENAIDSITV